MTEKVKSPAMEKHEYYRDLMKAAKTPVELSAIRTEYTVDTVVSDQSKSVLKSIYEMEEMRIKVSFTALPWQAAPYYAQKSDTDRVAESHAQDDKVAFKELITTEVVNTIFPEIEIITTNTNESITSNDPVTIPDTISETTSVTKVTANIPSEQPSGPMPPVTEPVWQNPVKRTRKSKEVIEWGVTSVTLSREIKLPIDGVQFSNNLFGITLTASTYEEARSLIEEAFADYTNSTKLLSKDHVDKAYAQWLADGKKVAPVPIPPMLKPATKVQYTTNEERAREMIKQMANSSPAALEFAKAFTAINPMLPTNNLV